MDKKTIIGLVLIFGLFICWATPTKEQREQQREAIEKANRDTMEAQATRKAIAEYNDSVATALRQQMLDSIAKNNPEALGDVEAYFEQLKAHEEQARQMAERVSSLGAFSHNVQEDSHIISVQNELFTVELSDLGAQVNQVVLSKFQTHDDQPLVLISPSKENMNMTFSTNDNHVINTNQLHFTAYVEGQPVSGDQQVTVEGDSLCVSFRAYADKGLKDSNDLTDLKDSYLEYCYTFYRDRYNVGYSIRFHGLTDIVSAENYVDFQWQNTMNRQEKVDPSARGKANPNKDRELWYSNIYWRPIGEKPDELKQGRDAERSKAINYQLDWVAFKQQFFCAILMNDNRFESADLVANTARAKDTSSTAFCDMSANLGLAYDAQQDCSVDMQFYFGPSKFSTLKKMDRDFEAMLSHGKFFLVRWTSRALVRCLNLFETFNWNYGIIIIVITFLLRFVVLFPLTYNSYKSTAVNRILRPEMEALNKKFPDQSQAMEKSRAMQQLQRAAGINPLMGCLPLLIQMPILFAMFRFIPTAVELRQQPFLWCNDLSNYDSILNFGFNIPLYGDHISLFCLLMFGIQFFYTWYTMKSNPSNANMPGMKFMMYFMPFMMLFMFNSQSAALNLYYFFSLFCTMTQMILIRKFTSEKKVRARMAAHQAKQLANKGKNGKGGKKSKFQQRLEEMQKLAEQQQKAQQRR